MFFLIYWNEDIRNYKCESFSRSILLKEKTLFFVFQRLDDPDCINQSPLIDTIPILINSDDYFSNFFFFHQVI